MIVHLTNGRFGINESWSFYKGAVFYLFIFLLLLPVFHDAANIIAGGKNQNIRIILKNVTLTMIVLMLLSFHAGRFTNSDWYHLRSLQPFDQQGDTFSRRLLMPALANLFLLRGEPLDYVFSALLLYVFLMILSLWNTKNTALPLWQFISLCTSSFVMLHFQILGSPNLLFYIFYLLVMFENVSQKSKLTLLVLALLTHESSVLIGFLLGYRYLTRKGILSYLLVVLIYTGVWVISSRGGLSVMVNAGSVGDVSGFEYFQRYPIREILGVFISYKILWVIFLWAIVLGLKSRSYTDVIFIVLSISIGISMTFIAVDTSRIMGQIFPALLVSLKIIYDKVVIVDKEHALAGIFASNLLVPSIYVGLIGGVFTWPGIYGWMYDLFYPIVVGAMRAVFYI